jgi:4-hydroxybenzoate polyprenyltransferase
MTPRQGAVLRIQYDTALDNNVLEPGVAIEGPDAATDRSRTQAFLPSAGSTKPLCVDLDGTLIRCDSLAEGLMSLISRPKVLGKLSLSWGMARRAALKQQVGLHSNLKPETLPYNGEFLTFLREQKLSGRRIVLATAADARIAHAIADNVGLFDEVIASDGQNNLKGAAKAKELIRRYGHKGFDYAGNSRTDLAVWREAEGIFLVNASPSVTRLVRKIGPVLGEFDRPRAIVPTALRAMRAYQWVKNLLVFVPIIASRSFSDVPALIATICLFASFCAAASGIYLINDLCDVEADRSHPRKHRRPIASGDLPPGVAGALAVALLSSGFALAFATGTGAILAIYVLVSVSYSLVLKKYPLIDVFILASLYTLRIIAGGIASGHRTTLWLLAFSGFTFLSLALIKRTSEMIKVRASRREAVATRRGYRPEDIPILEMFGISSAFASSVVLALFVGSAAAAQPYESSELLWAIVPLILFWQMWLWLSTERGVMHDDPIIYASKDWMSWIVAASTIAIILLASWAANPS